MDVQGWQLRRCLSFTQNRLANRPHRPRDPMLRKFLSELGYEWPEADAKNEEESPEDEEDGEGEDGEGEDGEGEEGEMCNEEGEEGEEEAGEEEAEASVDAVERSFQSLSMGGGEVQDGQGEGKDAMGGDKTDSSPRSCNHKTLQEPLQEVVAASPHPTQAPSSTSTPLPCLKSPPSLTPEAVSVTCRCMFPCMHA